MIGLGFGTPTVIIGLCATATIRAINKVNSEFKLCIWIRFLRIKHTVSMKDIFNLFQKNDAIDHLKNGRRQNKRRSAITADQNPYMLRQRISKRKANATRTITLMTSAFYITWMPYAVKCILAMLGLDLNLRLSALIILFAKLGGVFNPIIYIFYNDQVGKM